MGQELRKIAKDTKEKVHTSSSKAPAKRATAPTPRPVKKVAPTPAPPPFLATAPISLSPMDSSTMDAALEGVAVALNNKFRYLVIGGVALSKLGAGKRQTKDLDLLVPDNTLSHVVVALVATGNFEVEKSAPGGVPRIWFKAPNDKNYNVEIIEPKKLHHTVKFPSDTVKAQEAGTKAKLMLPAELLNLKILAYLMRKKAADHQDINNLVSWMFRRGEKTSQKEVTYADDDFLTKMTAGKDADIVKQWVDIGLAPPR